jgi:splicing factor U2AF subunit
MSERERKEVGDGRARSRSRSRDRRSRSRERARARSPPRGDAERLRARSPPRGGGGGGGGGDDRRGSNERDHREYRRRSRSRDRGRRSPSPGRRGRYSPERRDYDRRDYYGRDREPHYGRDRGGDRERGGGDRRVEERKGGGDGSGGGGGGSRRPAAPPGSSTSVVAELMKSLTQPLYGALPGGLPPQLLAQQHMLLLQQQQQQMLQFQLQQQQLPPGSCAPPPAALLAPPAPPPPALPLPASIGGFALQPPAAGVELAAMVARLGAGGGGGGGGAGAAAKSLRELFVGNLPEGSTAAVMRDFFNSVMVQLKLGRADLPGLPVVSFRTSTDAAAKFGFLEFRTPEDCDAALGLNGVQFNACALKVVRPKGYVAPAGGGGGGGGVGAQPPPVDLSALAPYGGLGSGASGAGSAPAPPPPPAGVLASMGLGGGSLFGGAALAPPLPPPVAPGEGAHVLHASNLLHSAAAVEGLRTMLAGFGPLRDFVALPPGESGGTATVLAAFSLPPGGLLALRERVDGALSLSGTPFMGGLPLRLERAGVAAVAAHLPAHAAAGPEPTPILELSNIVVVGEMDFGNAADVEELTADVRAECEKSGPVAHVVIPRAGGESAPGVSVPMYVAFDTVAGAVACAAAMRAKKFANRAVGTRFLPPAEWAKIGPCGEGTTG